MVYAHPELHWGKGQEGLTLLSLLRVSEVRLQSFTLAPVVSLLTCFYLSPFSALSSDQLGLPFEAFLFSTQN